MFLAVTSLTLKRQRQLYIQLPPRRFFYRGDGFRRCYPHHTRIVLDSLWAPLAYTTRSLKSSSFSPLRLSWTPTPRRTCHLNPVKPFHLFYNLRPHCTITIKTNAVLVLYSSLGRPWHRSPALRQRFQENDNQW